VSTDVLCGIRSRRRDDAGASAVEFALVVLPLFTLLIGIIQFSIYFWAWQAGAGAAREGARALAVDPNCSGLQGYLELHFIPGGVTDVSVYKTPADASGMQVGDVIEVDVEFTAFNVGFFPFFDGAVHERAESRVEHIPSTSGACG
jgi:hypothetical protein